MFTDQDYQTLTHLGLTVSQGKVYLTLAKVGQATIKTIAQNTKIARQDTYRIVSTLENMGLVEKIVFTPAIYKALPLEEGLSMLLQQKTEENAKLQEKTKALLSNFQENKVGTAPKREESRFVITSERKLFLKRFEETIDAAQMSVDFILPAEGFKKLLLDNFQQLKSVMGRGVKIRVITRKVENPKSILRITQDLKNNLLFKLKYTSVQYMIHMQICDNKETNFQVSDDIVPSMWSNNPAELELVTSYFESLWNNAQIN